MSNFRSIPDGREFTYNGRRYRRRGTRAIAMGDYADLGHDILDTVVDFVILDIVSDGELDGDFTVDSEPETRDFGGGGYESSYDSGFDSGGSDFGD